MSGARPPPPRLPALPFIPTKRESKTKSYRTVACDLSSLTRQTLTNIDKDPSDGNGTSTLKLATSVLTPLSKPFDKVPNGGASLVLSSAVAPSMGLKQDSAVLYVDPNVLFRKISLCQQAS